jgi:Flp pilus assembly protein TadG
MVGLLRKVHREQRGQALVETALAVPLLLLLIVGMVDFGRAYNYAYDLTHLANAPASRP